MSYSTNKSIAANSPDLQCSLLSQQLLLACEYPEDHSLLLRLCVLADHGTDGRVDDTGEGSQDASQPHQPGGEGGGGRKEKRVGREEGLSEGRLWLLKYCIATCRRSPSLLSPS